MKSLFLILFIPAYVYAQGVDKYIAFDEKRIDLGVVNKGDMVEDEFTFTNIADFNIEIDLVSTCECTTANWTRGQIKPGERGTIKFTFDSTKKEKAEPVDVDVYFLNDDPKTAKPLSAFLSYTFKYHPD